LAEISGILTNVGKKSIHDGIFYDFSKSLIGRFFPLLSKFSSVKIFLAIRNKKPFLDITYRLVLRGGGPLKKKLP
jgi:hypothetical protein